MRRLTVWFRARPDEWALLAVLLACYPVSAIVPPAWASEGNILESLQVAVLLGGFALALLLYARERPAPVVLLALWVAPAWLLLAGRELSWGRAWLPRPDAALPYQQLVWLGAALLLGWLAVYAWRYRIDQTIRSAFARRTPWLCFLVALAAAMGSTCAEGHMSCHLPLATPRAQVVEELVELVAYLALCAVQNVVFMQHARAVLCPPTKGDADKPRCT